MKIFNIAAKNTRFIFLVALISFALLASHVATARAQDLNLVPNPTLENTNTAGTAPLQWTTEKWGGNSATFTYQKTGHNSARSVYAKMTSYKSGDAKWYFTPVAVSSSADYIFSDYYMASVQTIIVAMSLDAKGNPTYIDIAAAVPLSSSTWKQATYSFRTPSNAKTLTVFHLIQKNGWLQIDDVSLTAKNQTPPPTPSFDFSLSSFGALSATQGQTATSSVTASLISGTTQPVSFSASGVPSGTTATFSSASCSPTCATTLTLATATTTPAGTYTITVTGTSGTSTRTTSFTLTVTVIAPPSSQNLVPNPSVENAASQTATTPTSWISEAWGTNKATFAYVRNQGHTGSSSVKVQMTSYTDGDAKWYFNPVTVTPGDTYKFSDWYQSNITSRVVVWFSNTDGTDYYLELRNAPPSANWTQYAESFQAPINAKTFTVFHLVSAVGWLATDDDALAKFTPVGFTRPLVTLTFDDGWEDNVLTALPILANYGYHATYFFATTYLESSPATGTPSVSGPAAVRATFSAGHEIGSHSVTHPDLTTVSSSQLTYELTHSKEYLESIVGAGKVKNFASPYGTYNETVLSALRSLYRSHRPTDEGFNSSDNFDQYRLKVENMTPNTSLSQYQSWINQAIKDKTWLILIYHRVASSNIGDYDTRLQDFQPQLDVIKNSGITVKTIDQALDEITPQVTH